MPGRSRCYAAGRLPHEGGRTLTGQPGVDQPEPLFLPRKGQPLQLRGLDPGGTVHVQAQEPGKGTQFGEHPGLMQFDPQGVGQAFHLPDADSAAAEGDQRLFAHDVEEFAHQPQGFGDRTQGRVAPQRGAGLAEPRRGGSQCEVLNDVPAAQRNADTMRQFNVGCVQRHQQAPGQQPVHGADVVTFVNHGGAALRLGNGTHGPVPEPGE